MAALLAAPATAGSVRLGRWTGLVEFGLDYHRKNEAMLNHDPAFFERGVAGERFTFRNTLTVIDPRFLTVNFGVNIGLHQARIAVVGDNDSGSGRLLGFDLSATALATKPYGLTLTAGRTAGLTPVLFSGSRAFRMSNLGLSIGLGPRGFPGKFSYRGAEVESISDLNSITFRGLDQRRQTLTYTGSNRWRRQELYTSFQFQDVDDRINELFSNRSSTANLSHTLEILAPDLVTLRSALRYFERRGDLNQRSFNLDEVFRLQHRDNLSSGLRFQFRKIGDASLRTDQVWSATAWVHHRLYESLEAEFRLGRDQLATSSSGRSRQDEARLQLTYRKNLPRRGRLLSMVRTAYQRGKNDFGQSEQLVMQEPHVARFGVPTRLRRPRVIPGSVEVTDALDATIFEENLDYELRFVDDFAEILPVPGGNIRDGQGILVTYRTEAPSERESSVLTADFDVSIDYRWVTPFFGYRSTRDRPLAGPVVYDDRRELFGGARFRWTGQRLKFFSFNEWRSRRSRLVDFESFRFANTLTYSPRPSWVLDLDLAHIRTTYHTAPREVRINDVRASVHWAPGAVFTLETYGGNRTSHDTTAADQTFRRLGVEARWNLGKVSLISTIERWQQIRNGNDLVGVNASVKISRRFFPGAVSARRRRQPLEPWPTNLPGMQPVDYPAGGAWSEAAPARVIDE